MMLDAANDWEWIDKAPALPEWPEPPIRIRWITREEARRLPQPPIPCRVARPGIVCDWLGVMRAVVFDRLVCRHCSPAVLPAMQFDRDERSRCAVFAARHRNYMERRMFVHATSNASGR
ncbi:hypothetical protein [Paraburkholderia ultramafica]|nr:hypothetical protein [Paraburkholderia ultramafica]